MGTLSQAKTLGGVGSILVLLSIVPFAGPVLGIVGFILTLIAVKYVSDVVADRSIFNNMIISVVLSIVGLAVGVLIVFSSLFAVFGLGFLRGGAVGPDFVPPTVAQADILGFIATALIGLAAIWVFFLIAAVFLRRSYRSIAVKLNVGMFGTAALLYLIGAGLIIVVVGFIIIFVAQILQVVAFFSIPDQAPQPPSTGSAAV